MFFAILLAAVLPPWTPVQTTGYEVSVWGRTYAFASNALPVSVKSLGRELLSGPMRVVAKGRDGSDIVWKKGGSWVQEKSDELARTCAFVESPEVTVSAVATTEFDGMMKLSFAVVPGPARHRNSIGALWLEIPMRREIAKLYQYFPFPWGKCNNAGVVDGAKAWPFLASVWLGDEKAGLCWFCESDELFVNADPSRVIEVVPQGNETVLRIRLIERETSLPRTFVFGLEATPVKPYDRGWNANHVLHAPQMGVGITIKRPEVWWTAQRAFPGGPRTIDKSLDDAVAAGVKTIVFHEDWIPIQNNPGSYQSDFKPIVEACHRRGLKVLVYAGYELSSFDSEWGDHWRDWLLHGADGCPSSCWYRPPAQRDYRACQASGGYAATWLARAKAAYEELGIDGYYLDGTIVPTGCANGAHGCGWTDGDGKLHLTYPIFAVRRTMRELYAFVHARGGKINAHQSGYTCPATLGFVHSYWDGEQLATESDSDVKRQLSPEAFRAEFMGRNFGVPCEFLCYERPGKWSYEEAFALTLLHDVPVRPNGFVSLPRFAAVWKTLDDFRATEAEFVPYWEAPLEVSPSSVKASVYRHRNGRSLAVVSNLSPDKSVEAEVKLPKGEVKRFTLAPFGYVFVNFHADNR